MQAIELAIAFVPVAIYLMLIGGLRMRSRPLVTTGWRDTLTLGIACFGLVAIGPMQLFFPAQAAARWHGWVWLALLALYILAVLMLVLSCKPRLIAYGLNQMQFRSLLEKAATSIDEDSHWDGDVLNVPGAGMQLALDPSGAARVQQVVHFGILRDFHQWVHLERAFVKLSKGERCPRSIAGLPMILAGGLLLAIAIGPSISDPETAFEQLQLFINR
jgi:hypothetical protein